MSDSDSDEELKRAIALSLEQPSPISASENRPVINLISDDEDDSLDAPQKVLPPSKRPQVDDTKTIPASLSSRPKGKAVQSVIKSSNSITTSSTLDTNSQKPVTPSGSSLLGLDRKFMEAERRARAVQATKNQAVQTVKDQAVQTTKDQEKITEFESRKRNASQAFLKSASDAPLPEAKKARPSQINDSYQIGQTALPIQSSGVASSPIQYPNGVVKRTWVNGFSRQSIDITIEEVLQRETLQYAVLSAFQVDPTWIQTKIEPTTRVVWVLQAKTNAEKQRWIQDADKSYRFCFPSMEGNINCMHSKLQLLVHPTHLRVVIPSGNLTSYDWGETGVVENVCFLIDLPRLPDDHEPSYHEAPFKAELKHFVDAMGLEKNLVKSLDKFDFTQTSRLGFVHSIGGSHVGDALRQTGFPGLATCVREMNLATDEALEVDFVAGSIGSISYPFVNSMIMAAQGVDELSEDDLRIKKGSKANDEKLAKDLQDRCRIYFPTQETVANSKGGINAGGTICFDSKWYDSAGFPSSLMRDCQSTRKGLLVHSKMWFVRHKIWNPENPPAWAYVGSANLSESAWGRLVKDKTTKKDKLNVRNWECGVIFPAPAPKDEYDEPERVEGMDVFRGHVPVPMVTPGKPYDGIRPWFYKEH